MRIMKAELSILVTVLCILSRMPLSGQRDAYCFIVTVMYYYY